MVVVVMTSAKGDGRSTARVSLLGMIGRRLTWLGGDLGLRPLRILAKVELGSSEFWEDINVQGRPKHVYSDVRTVLTRGAGVGPVNIRYMRQILTLNRCL